MKTDYANRTCFDTILGQLYVDTSVRQVSTPFLKDS